MPPTPRHTLAFGGLAALAAAMGIGRFAYTPILPGMMADLGLSAGQAGLIASANYAGYLIGALAALAPMPLPRRLVLVLALILSSATTLAMAGLSAPAAMIAVRFVGGLASAAVMVIGSGLVLQHSATIGDRAAPGVHFAGVGVGIVLSALLVAIVQGAGLDWRADWLMSGAVSGLLTVIAVLKLRDVSAADSTAVKQSPAFAGGIGLLALAYGLFGLGYVVTATFLVAIIRGEPSLRPVEPFVWLIVGIFALFSVPLWLKIAARWGTLTAYAAACVVEAVGVAASVGMLDITGMLLAATLLGATFMGITALGLVAARERAAGDPQRLLAAMTAVFGAGQIIGPVVAGHLHDATGDYRLASYGAAVVLILSGLCAIAAKASSQAQ